jgi:hypothetical protein
MTATTVADTARHDQRKRVIRIAQAAFSVAILVGIFAYAIRLRGHQHSHRPSERHALMSGW